jgi:hypothetical protein
MGDSLGFNGDSGVVIIMLRFILCIHRILRIRGKWGGVFRALTENLLIASESFLNG